MVIENRLYWNRKTRKIRPKYENNGTYSDLLTQFDGWDRMIHKRGRQAPAAAADDDGYDTEIYTDDDLPPNSDDDVPKPKKIQKKT